MELYIAITVEWLFAFAFVAYMLREVRRNRELGEAHLREVEASTQATVAEVEAELARFKATLPPDLVIKLELSDEEPSPDLFTASEQVKPLVFSLSQQEQLLGGSGFVLTAAKVELGTVRLTLSPVDRVGSAERVRRVAEEWNARGGPLPPGVTAAHADVLAA